jgi:hypothetical protein
LGVAHEIGQEALMKPAHYVDNKKLLEELTAHREAVQQAKAQHKKKPKLSDYVGKCILLIANKLSNRPNFINYPFKDEMISDGIENCLMYIDNFDPNKSSNPFAYITQIVYFAFIRRITREKKHLYTKHKMIERSMIFNELATQSEYNEQTEQSFFENEHMNDFVRSFEETNFKKKKKKIVGIEKFIEEDITTLEKEILNDADSINN